MIHYRQNRKSDYFGSVEVEQLEMQGQKCLVTIAKVEYKENLTVNGVKKDKAIILTFTDKALKPWIANATNCIILQKLTGKKDALEWVGATIELYVDTNVKMKGETVGGVRVRPILPQLAKKPLFTEEMFEKAKTAGADIEAIKKAYEVTENIEKQYLDFVAGN